MMRRSPSGDFVTEAADMAPGLLPGRFLTNAPDVNGIRRAVWRLVGLPLVQADILAGASLPVAGAAGYQNIGRFVAFNQDANLEPGFSDQDRYVSQVQVEAVNADASAHTLGFRLFMSLDGGAYAFVANVGADIAARSMAQNVATEFNMLALHTTPTPPVNSVRFSLYPVVDYAAPNAYITITRLSLVTTRIRPV